MARACGHDYAAACHLVSSIEIDGVRIPFASPVLLWKTKQTHREKDELDLVFLRKLLMDRGEWPVTRAPSTRPPSGANEPGIRRYICGFWGGFMAR
jgi:hypothetical protein